MPNRRIILQPERTVPPAQHTGFGSHRRAPRNALRPNRTEGATEVETAGTTGVKFAPASGDSVAASGRAVAETAVCGRLLVAVCSESEVQSVPGPLLVGMPVKRHDVDQASWCLRRSSGRL